jgi:hypothetical protein
VRISYVAGYDPADRDLAPLVQAAILLFGHFNANREAVVAAGGVSCRARAAAGRRGDDCAVSFARNRLVPGAGQLRERITIRRQVNVEEPGNRRPDP